MEILFLFPEFKKNSLAIEYIEKYIRNTSKFVKTKAVPFKNLPVKNEQTKKKKEAQAILKNITESDFVVLFDEKGKSFTSRGFAEKLKDESRRVVFIIGGPYGFDDSLYDRAQLKVSLSALTFNAEVATVAAAEQIFRIFSINAGHPYHND